MGVPKFFRWITEKYPQINVRISEGRRRSDYVDAFYLDMNGIIHTCTHGDGVDPSEKLSEDEQVERIFAYTERLIKIANPRKVCYLAIDGVAPRAKMNQQRSRRYRVPAEIARQALRDQANGRAQGTPGTPEEEAAMEAAPEPFDSNCITPGTDFLFRLGERYKEWIERKQRDDPTWANGPTIIFSGADVPGEGEHKIMDYIRDTRAESRDMTRHCMYGLDADLIMLGMITHEEHFCLLRERQRFQRGKFAPRGRGGRGAPTPTITTSSSADDASGKLDDADFVFMELELLRKCLAASMRPRVAAGSLRFEWDDERAVDDFVFLCMLVGNDFIPGLPSLDVADGGLNLMMKRYTELLPSLDGFISHKSKLHFDRFERFTNLLHADEGYVVRKKLRADSKPGRRVDPGELDEEPDEYRRRYSLQKLGLHPNDKEGRRKLVHAYLSGLCWCLAYYHEGCRSWNWYFPEFYAPLATDLVDLASYEVELELGEPFLPLAQLLSVLPPQSGKLVPAPYRELMLSDDSPIFDAFPVAFELDFNGKRNDWEAIALLPFIDEKRLLSAIDAIDPADLTDEERRRNQRAEDIVYIPPGRSRVEEAVEVS